MGVTGESINIASSSGSFEDIQVQALEPNQLLINRSTQRNYFPGRDHSLQQFVAGK